MFEFADFHYETTVIARSRKVPRDPREGIQSNILLLAHCERGIAGFTPGYSVVLTICIGRILKRGLFSACTPDPTVRCIYPGSYAVIGALHHECWQALPG
jgi:hypothetical protein